MSRAVILILEDKAGLRVFHFNYSQYKQNTAPRTTEEPPFLRRLSKCEIVVLRFRPQRRLPLGHQRE
jgi:hypothetical protein